MLPVHSFFFSIIFYAASIQARYVFYYDQYHKNLPPTTMNTGIDHVIMAFANSSLFTTSPAGEYVPFEDIPTLRTKFDADIKVLIAVGGWGDTAGFSMGAATEESRKLYATNIAAMLEKFGFDGVDIDWEYPGGNSSDYKQSPNEDKVSEIETYPLLLAEIRAAIGPKKLLTIATPGKVGDLMAFTPETAPSIWRSVDWVNLMSYDLFNRRDKITKHHTDVKASLEIVDYYLNKLSLDPLKLNLGFPMYAKWATIDANQTCQNGLGCATAELESPDGSDTGLSGAITFELENYATPPTNMTESVDGACGPTAGTFCAAGNCCSAFGFCGDSAAHCDACLGPVFGSGCKTESLSEKFQTAMKNGVTDEQAGGEYYYDQQNNLFWTWDTPQIISRKFNDIVKPRNLGGVMAWSLGQDSFDFSHILALQKGVAEMKTSTPNPSLPTPPQPDVFQAPPPDQMTVPELAPKIDPTSDRTELPPLDSLKTPSLPPLDSLKTPNLPSLDQETPQGPAQTIDEPRLPPIDLFQAPSMNPTTAPETLPRLAFSVPQLPSLSLSLSGSGSFSQRPEDNPSLQFQAEFKSANRGQNPSEGSTQIRRNQKRYAPTRLARFVV
ncbi:BgTH12-01774 [Blumeria graminis f. sp. triticale]|uniref:BgTH12-01770 n=1 Tax=Blumeria graminis f. sp. triticale TaxID=1689686 RepID=A0A9W4D040_BLUGR|nr:BgTH12-01770 [Blumeria graminis f. sp. triticale]CAD6501520.1 BgTH12-01772 [Blumeria graminis f. sp. triticale]CAD6501522.1 BgTH12-01774 [Blumeria graminis f. sp. triticale]